MPSSTKDRVLDALGPYGVKETPAGSGKYRCNSPLSPGSNSHSFSITFTDSEHGYYNDFNPAHGDHGSLYALADKLGLDHPSGKDEAVKTKRIIKNLDEYARDHGITGDHLRSRGWRDDTYHERGVKHRAISFPTAGGKRYRLLDVDEGVYRSTPGTKMCWYGLTEARQMEDQAIVMTNGEISTEAGLFYKVAACCITQGEKALPAHLLKIFMGAVPKDRPVWIAFDCDPAGRKAGASVYDQLLNAGYEHVRNLDLNLTAGGDFADLARLYTDGLADHLLRLGDFPVERTESDRAKQPIESVGAKDKKADNETCAQLVNVLHGQDYRFDPMVDTWYEWVGTHWLALRGKPVELRKKIRDVIQKVGLSVTDARISDIRELFSLHVPHIFESFFDSGLINFQNGTLEIGGLQLRKHDKGDHLIACLDYDYQPVTDGLGCPTIARILTENVPDTEAIRAYMSHLGAALCRDSAFHQCLIIKGGTRTGKTTLLNLALLVSGQEKDGFAPKEILNTELEGMRSRSTWGVFPLVCLDEFPEGAIREDGGEDLFKAMAAHGGVGMRAMYLNERTSNKWRPKMIFATNNIPRWVDRSGAIKARILIIECPNVREELELEREKMLFVKFRAELGTFAALCLREWFKTEKRGAYPQSDNMRALLNDIERSGDSIKLWVYEKVERYDGKFLSTKELYTNFRDFCAENGYSPMSRGKFMDALGLVIPATRPAKRRSLVEGTSKPAWGLENIRWKIEKEEEESGRSDSGAGVPVPFRLKETTGTGINKDVDGVNPDHRSGVPVKLEESGYFLEGSDRTSDNIHHSEEEKIYIPNRSESTGTDSTFEGSNPPTVTDKKGAFRYVKETERFKALPERDQNAFRDWVKGGNKGVCPLDRQTVHECVFSVLDFEAWWILVRGADRAWIDSIEEMET